ncbi:actin lateral binding protein [Melampsora americana]|nr:actin lateral binding protein [Melampsora americana]
MDKIKEKLATLRAEADAAIERAEAAEAKNKKLELETMNKDQELISLQHKVSNLEADLEIAEKKITDAKTAREEEETNRSTNENLNRKIALLESELDNAEKNLRETTDKLRQVDVKAEHFERQVQRIEAERDSWEKKWEETQEKYVASKRELEEVVQQMEVRHFFELG